MSQKKINFNTNVLFSKVYGGILDTGIILSIKDGVAKVNGLLGVQSGEMVTIGLTKIKGMVLSLEFNSKCCNLW